MKIVVGLGNPGKQYNETRHNIWFAILDSFVWYNSLWSFEYNNKFWAEYCETYLFDQKVIFLKPMTFMNKSWIPLHQVASFYKVDLSDILVVHDDIDLDLWIVKFKSWWWHAGHNWLRNIIEQFDSRDFKRIRIGVWRASQKKDMSDYVLGKFKNDEIEKIYDRELDIFEIINEFLK